MIEFLALSKTYGAFRALAPLTLTVSKGEMFGFLGPNGAGKTTTIRMMMSILVPSGGAVRIAGLDCHRDAAEVKRHVGYLPDSPIFYDYLRGREILQFIGEMHGLTRAESQLRAQRLMAELGLGEVSEEFAVNYSMGMKKKLLLARALLHDPQVMYLDEPTANVDPQARAFLLDAVRALRARGKAIVYASHYMEEVESLCDRIAIIDHGRLLQTGTLTEIYADPSHRRVGELIGSPAMALLDATVRGARLAVDGYPIPLPLSGLSLGAKAEGAGAGPLPDGAARARDGQPGLGARRARRGESARP